MARRIGRLGGGRLGAGVKLGGVPGRTRPTRMQAPTYTGINNGGKPPGRGPFEGVVGRAEVARVRYTGRTLYGQREYTVGTSKTRRYEPARRRGILSHPLIRQHRKAAGEVISAYRKTMRTLGTMWPGR